MAENLSNNYTTTLAAAITSTGATSITVASATGAPAANFRIRVGNELMLVTNVSGATFTVTRGIEGTTAATALLGASVVHVLTAAGFAQTVRDTPLTDLSLATSTAVTASDSVLSAIGKLQASKFDKTGGELSGDLNFSGTGRKLLARLSGTPGRLVVQNSVENIGTYWTLVPNGTANAAQVDACGSADWQNSTFSRCGVAGTTVYHTGSTRGTGAACTEYRWGVSGSVSWTINSTGNMLPAADAAYDAGSASLRLKAIFCSNATINTSDAREKTPVRSLTAAERSAAKALLAEIGIYQFLDAVAEKGEDGARLHTGMTVQRAIEVMEAHGLDPMRYGFICHDEWAERVDDIEDEAGDQVRIVPQQATIDTEVETSEIELIDGMPTLVSRTAMQRTPATDLRAVVADDGTAVLGEDGQPLMYPVPVMRDVEQRFRRVVTPAGDRYSFRETRLILFILAGIIESL